MRATRASGSVDQHVGRLQILVQHAGPVGDRQRLGALRHQIEPQRSIASASQDHPAARAQSGRLPPSINGDWRQKRASVRKWWSRSGTKPPAAAVVADIVQQAEDRHFPLQRGHARQVCGEFEDPRVAVAILRQPDIALTADPRATRPAATPGVPADDPRQTGSPVAVLSGRRPRS